MNELEKRMRSFSLPQVGGTLYKMLSTLEQMTHSITENAKALRTVADRQIAMRKQVELLREAHNSNTEVINRQAQYIKELRDRIDQLEQNTHYHMKVGGFAHHAAHRPNGDG